MNWILADLNNFINIVACELLANFFIWTFPKSIYSWFFSFFSQWLSSILLVICSSGDLLQGVLPQRWVSSSLCRPRRHSNDQCVVRSHDDRTLRQDRLRLRRLFAWRHHAPAWEVLRSPGVLSTCTWRHAWHDGPVQPGPQELPRRLFQLHFRLLLPPRQGGYYYYRIQLRYIISIHTPWPIKNVPLCFW